MQKCVIHQIRNTTRFVSYKDIKPLMADLKRVYAAVDEPAALAGDWIVLRNSGARNTPKRCNPGGPTGRG